MLSLYLLYHIRDILRDFPHIKKIPLSNMVLGDLHLQVHQPIGVHCLDTDLPLISTEGRPVLIKNQANYFFIVIPHCKYIFTKHTIDFF